MPAWTSVKSWFLGVLVTRLMLPPAPPRPENTESGPLTTSTCSRLKVSRDCVLGSRRPSTKRLLAEFWPRMNGRSLAGRPPSPAVIDIPGALRSTASRSLAPWSWMSRSGMTCTVRGVSARGAVNLGDWALSG
ncbi:Uncharacterised protein [Bordetella pertussis]|nr:Uncharacterised protein [Bordetella pertussis]